MSVGAEYPPAGGQIARDGQIETPAAYLAGRNTEVRIARIDGEDIGPADVEHGGRSAQASVEQAELRAGLVSLTLLEGKGVPAAVSAGVWAERATIIAVHCDCVGEIVDEAETRGRDRPLQAGGAASPIIGRDETEILHAHAEEGVKTWG